MLCENCGKNKANVRYTQVINGEKKEMHLCEECSEKLGIGNMDFKMPINFSSFLGDFFNEFENDNLLPEFSSIKDLKCDRCGLTFQDFMNSGKFGCSSCYDAFQSKIDPILKNIHGANKHVGRLGEINPESELHIQENGEVEEKKEEKELSELDKLKEELKKAISEENYEEAAKIRDEIKKIEK